MRRRILIAACCLLLCAGPGLSGPIARKQITVSVEAGKHDRTDTPVCIPLSLPKSIIPGFKAFALVTTPDDKALESQITLPGLLTEAARAEKGEVRGDLLFIVPRLKAGESLKLKVSIYDEPLSGTEKVFAWHDGDGEQPELRFDKRPVLRYVANKFEDSTKEKREATFKVYHHLYEPSGKAIITKGPGGLYTHHRGLFYGFKATYGDPKVTADTWHCPPPSGDPKKPSLEAHLEHEKVLSNDVGTVLGRHRVQIGWFGRNKERFAVEERELTVYNVPGGTLVEFASKLTPVKGTVKLDGDPQHAGFHFRAANEVDKNKDRTYFLRPFGKGEMGKERNWPEDKKMADLPWNAMSFVVGGKRYTAAYLDRPANPKEARYSERTYGRFGSYFVAECADKKPLTVAYRLWLQEGEMTKEGVEARSVDFVTPPTATVK
jgi:hypothetical protein